MAVFRRRFTLATQQHDEVVDITREVERVLAASGVRDGVLLLRARRAAGDAHGRRDHRELS
jgi:thiamine phosphate synthase YjbQ (UPF0047 family)